MVYEYTADEHNLAFCRTLQRLHNYGLTLNKNKCIFDKPSIQLFGVMFSKDRLLQGLDKIGTLKKSTPPTNAAKVCPFLGMTNFSADFIPNYSIITTPL